MSLRFFQALGPLVSVIIEQLENLSALPSGSTKLSHYPILYVCFDPVIAFVY